MSDPYEILAEIAEDNEIEIGRAEGAIARAIKACHGVIDNLEVSLGEGGKGFDLQRQSDLRRQAERQCERIRGWWLDECRRRLAAEAKLKKLMAEGRELGLAVDDL